LGPDGEKEGEKDKRNSLLDQKTSSAAWAHKDCKRMKTEIRTTYCHSHPALRGRGVNKERQKDQGEGKITKVYSAAYSLLNKGGGTEERSLAITLPIMEVRRRFFGGGL